MSDRKRMIAVDDNLTNVRETLERAGYKTAKISLGTMTNVAACVVSGLHTNFMGFHDTHDNKFPVIDAAGMSADEVLQALQKHENTQNVT